MGLLSRIFWSIFASSLLRGHSCNIGDAPNLVKDKNSSCILSVVDVYTSDNAFHSLIEEK